jgi:cell division protein FtsQ
MDGGGRFYEPLTAGQSGGAASRATALPARTKTRARAKTKPGAQGLLAPGSSPASFLKPSAATLGSLALGANPFRRNRDQRRSRSLAARIERKLPRRLGTWLLAGFLAATTIVGMHEGGQITAFFEEHGRPHHVAAKLVGLGIEEISISGMIQLREGEILGAAGISPKVSLPFLDVALAREGLEALPLVQSASVRKLYPDGVIISLVEREPYALWQVDGEVYVISMDGEVIDIFRPDPRYVALPLVVGEAANGRLDEYFGLVDSAGPLTQRIRAGTLVAERRWTLKLDNGMDVRLPETDPMGALQRLVDLEERHGLLEKDVIAIDLRMPDRVVVRLTEEAQAERAEKMKKLPMRGREVRT